MGGGVVKPWLGFVTLVDVEHDDAVIRVPVTIGGGVIEMLGINPEQEVERPQGIAAGAVMETGEGVPDLRPGSKIYYIADRAVIINDVRVVHATQIIAYEEAP